MAGILQGEVDGIPTFHVANSRPVLSASLIFRCGMVDETLITSGWLHLLEHLALHGSAPAHVDVNGSVGLLFTSLDVSGEPGDVAARLSRAAERLHALDPRVVSHELQVLSAEQRMRPAGPFVDALLWRYGARGAGLRAYGEPGLSRATPEALGELAARVFTRGNAVLCLSGPIPPGLRFDLPDGDRIPVPPLEPLDQPVPSVYHHPHDSVILTGLVPRTVAAVAATSILAARVVEGLRHRQGLAYSPGGTYEPLGPDEAVAAVWADLAPASATAAWSEIARAVRAVAADGPTEAELAEHVKAALLQASDPLALPGQAWAAGRDELLGRPTHDDDQLSNELEALTIDQVADAAQRLAASRMVGVPSTVTVDPTKHAYLQVSEDPPMPGRTFRPRAGSLGLTRTKSRVVVNGVFLQRVAQDSHVTVNLSEVEGVLAWPDGARRLIRPDGYAVHQEPSLWRRGQELTDWIDGQVAPERILRLPSRKADEIPRPLAPLERLAAFRNWSLVLTLVALLVVLIGAAVLERLPAGSAWMIIPVVVIFAAAMVVARGSDRRG